MREAPHLPGVNAIVVILLLGVGLMDMSLGVN